MRLPHLSSLVALLFILLLHQQAIAQSESLPTVVLQHINVIDVKDGNILRNKTVEIDSGIIARIATGQKKKYLPNTIVIDASDKYLIPGLWDMHVHITRGVWSNPEKTFALMIANGITGIREMGGYLTTLKKWKVQINNGTLIGPQIMAAGPILYGSISAGPMHIAVPSAEAAHRIVDSLQQAGADFIKVYNFLERAPYHAIAEETKKLNMAFEGHVPLSVTLIEASNAGQKSIEHVDCPFFIEECTKEFARFRQMDIDRIPQLRTPFNPSSVPAWIAQMHYLDSALLQFDPKKADTIYSHFLMNHTWQCPTLIILKMFSQLRDSSLMEDSLMKYAYASNIRTEWNYKTYPLTAAMKDEEYAIQNRFYLKSLQIVRDMKKRGIGFLAGTDVGNQFIYPGFSLHQELQLLVQAGFTPLEALQTTTINPALFFGLQDSLGSVDKGKYADLIVLNANPLNDIANTQRIEAVIVKGKYYSRKQLDSLLNSVIVKK